MNTLTLVLASALLSSPLAPCTVLPDGGPPSIRLAGKASGDITAAQWSAASSVELMGCVPTARITALTLCIKDCKAKDATSTSVDGSLTPFMKRMIQNLPAGTPFTIKVVVKDAKGKTWDVPDARFVWKG